MVTNIQDALGTADQDGDGQVSDTENISHINSIQGLIFQSFSCELSILDLVIDAMHALVSQVADLIEAASDLFVRSCYTFPSLVRH